MRTPMDANFDTVKQFLDAYNKYDANTSYSMRKLLGVNDMAYFDNNTPFYVPDYKAIPPAMKNAYDYAKEQPTFLSKFLTGFWLGLEDIINTIPNLTNVLLYLSGSQLRLPPFLHTSLDDCYQQTLQLLQRDQKLGSASDYALSVGAMRLLTMIGIGSIGSAASAADDGLNAFLDTMGDDAYIADLTADTADVTEYWV